MTNSEKAALSRRTFVKGSALAGLGAAAMGSTSLFGCAPQGQGDAEPPARLRPPTRRSYGRTAM